MAELSQEELWCPVFYVRPGRTPARSRINHLLKHAGAWGIEYVQEMDPAAVEILRRENAELRVQSAQFEGKCSELSRASRVLVVKLQNEAGQLKEENAELRAEVARLTGLLD